jgi:hypothetical protein
MLKTKYLLNIMYSCEKCNLKFKTYNGFWKHNKNKHNDNSSNTDLSYKHKCSYCSNTYKHKQSKWAHERSCKESNIPINLETLQKELNEVKSELDRVKNKPATIINNNNINKGTINRGPVYNFLTKPGEENLNMLSETEIEYIMEQEMNCLITLVELVNFNEKHPENHSFCNTALNDKYISTMNTETMTIEKQRKKDFFDMTLSNGIRNMKLLYEKMGEKAKKTPKAIKYKETIDNLTEFVLINNKGKKTYVELMNILTFNKRHITKLTWSQLTNNQIPGPNLENNIGKMQNKIDDIGIICNTKLNKLKYIHDDNTKICDSNIDSDFDSDLSSDTESDDSDLDELPTIIINKQTFILDKNFLYTIVHNKKGELYGSLVNGKFRRLRPKEIEV